jgi:methanogenic corrinoid protein MtbC1
MFEVAGWNVYDLGKDVPLDKFVDEMIKTGSEVVGISALMTTSMLAMPEIIRRLRANNPNVRVMIGGAPINPEIVEKYGADGYAKTAGTAVDEAIRLLEMLRKEELGKGSGK